MGLCYTFNQGTEEQPPFELYETGQYPGNYYFSSFMWLPQIYTSRRLINLYLVIYIVHFLESQYLIWQNQVSSHICDYISVKFIFLIILLAKLVPTYMYVYTIRSYFRKNEIVES